MFFSHGQRIALSAALIVALVPVALAGAQAPAAAQSVSVLAGTVTDGSGNGIGGAHVSVSGATGKELVTKSDGSFSLSLAPGVYTVVISAKGFQTTQSDVTVTSAPTKVSVTLSPASLTTIGRVSSGSGVTVNKSSSANATLTASSVVSQGQNQLVNVLDGIPGVELFRANGGSNEPGANTSISIRGAEPYETQVLFDGHPVNTFGNGAFGFNTTFISSQLLSDVQVSKGPGNLPNTVGNAVGGTVNFQTANITSKPTVSFVTGTDTYSGFYYAGKFSDTFGKLGILVAASRNVGPGYLAPQSLFGGDDNYEPSGVPAYPNPSTAKGPTAYTGVLNFAYPATSDYYFNNQLAKLSYNFSQATSVLFSQYSSQSYVDETGNNEGNILATIVPCITTGTHAAPTCTGPQTGSQNYTATPFLGYVGQTVPINYYAGYPSTYEIDNEPIYTGEFRTVLGPGTLLARYYAGSITRNVIQQPATGYISPCYSPACPFMVDGFAGNGDDNGYPGEPYLEETSDILHGFDAQYSLLFGADSLTLGFDRHTDEAFFNEFYSDDSSAATAYLPTINSPSFFSLQSLSYSLRTEIQLLKTLKFQFGGYLSTETYIATRFDPRGGFVFTPSANTSIRAAFGSAYVSPYYELVAKTGVHSHILYEPGTTFSPETSTSYDIGLDQKLDKTSVLSADLYYTTIYNRYASINVPISGSLNGVAYNSTTITGSEGNGFQNGAEVQLTHRPTTGFGYHVALDLLRDYAYNQIKPASSNNNSIYGSALPNNGVQLPGYPYSKGQGDLYYTFGNGAYVRVSDTTFGANNAYGQNGFSLFGLQYSLPITHFATLNVGGNNVSIYNNGLIGGLYNAGYTYQTLGGGVGSTNFEPVQPQTWWFQLQFGVGKK